MFYGLTRPNQLHEMIEDVAGLFPGSNFSDTVKLLTETCMQETKLGTYRDPSADGAGRGVSQFDKIAVGDTINRSARHHQAIIAEFGIDLAQVDHNDLDFSPLLCVVLMRLKYMLVPSALPSTTEGRAAYWKRYYNTVAGKGTESEYMANALDIRYIISDGVYV